MYTKLYKRSAEKWQKNFLPYFLPYERSLISNKSYTNAGQILDTKAR